MKILIKNAYILDMVGSEPNIKKQDLLIDDNIISKIDIDINDTVDKIIDGTNKLLMPGLINTHTHMPMSIFRGYKDELKLEDWLNNAIFPIEAKMDEDDVYYGAYLSCIEMIKGGTTTCNDMYFTCEKTIQAVEETGLRALISWSINDFLIKDFVEKTKYYANLYNKDNSRIKIISTFHAPYTCNPDTIKLVTNLAKDINSPIHIHLSETEKEEKTIQERYGKSSTKYLYDLGVFDHKVILAHSIHMSNDDINILKSINCGLSTNPISNAKLSSGICDIVRLRKEGFNIGIGTDGQGSTTTLDMFEEMRTLGYLQKLNYKDPTIIKAYDILKMATIEGAKVLGLDKETGTIEIGKKADIILIDINKPHLWPLNDICTNIVYSANASDINTTIVDGKILMENRKLINIDEKNIMNEVKKCIDKLLK